MKKYPVYLSPLANYKLNILIEQIETEWGLAAKGKFLSKFEKTKIAISIAPYSCAKSEMFGGIRKCVVTRQTSYFYRILPDALEIITITDNRQDPNKLNKEIRLFFGL